MSFLAKLELDDKTYNVLECEYDFTQNIDEQVNPRECLMVEKYPLE